MKPYDLQTEFTKKTFEAVVTGQNALLESPTGTGKTLCLITGAMEALKHLKDLQKSQHELQKSYQSPY